MCDRGQLQGNLPFGPGKGKTLLYYPKQQILTWITLLAVSRHDWSWTNSIANI
jgi:hypothetical protein